MPRRPPPPEVPLTAGRQVTLRILSWHSDGDWPAEGDFVRTRAGSCYLIEELIPAGPRATRTIFKLRCTRLEKNAVSFGDPGVHWFEFERRRL